VTISNFIEFLMNMDRNLRFPVGYVKCGRREGLNKKSDDCVFKIINPAVVSGNPISGR
jgi:hypothetical protein